MTKEHLKTIEHNGARIAFCDDGSFLAIGVEDWPSHTHTRFASLRDAKDAIDKHVASLLKQKKAQTSIAIGVLTRFGEPTIVRGIHAGTSDLLLGKGHESNVFPDVPWLKEILTEYKSLLRRKQAIERLIRPYEINRSRGYGRLPAEVYDERVKNFTDELEAKKAKAEATNERTPKERDEVEREGLRF